MIYLLALVVYGVIIGGGIRFFQAVHSWDEKARSLMQREILSRRSEIKTHTARRRALSVSA